jgi:hypothetical protein
MNFIVITSFGLHERGRARMGVPTLPIMREGDDTQPKPDDYGKIAITFIIVDYHENGKATHQNNL